MKDSPLLKRTAEPLLRADRKVTQTNGSAPKGAAANGGQAATWSRLNFTMLQQEQGNWCWCATSLSVHSYYNPANRLTQCQAANLILGRNDACTNPTGADVNKPWFLDDGLSDLGNLREPVTSGMVGWDAVKAEVEAGRPLGCRTAWSGGGAHFVFIEGFLEGSPQMVAVDDPAGGQSDVNFETFKTAYSGSGSWTHTYKVKSSRIRLLNAQVPASAAVTAVSRHPNKLDAFVVDNGGRVLTAATDDGLDHGPWRGWWEIPGLRATPGAPVACVDRGPDRLDVFVVGTDGGIYTAAWDQHQAKAAWRGWWRIGNVVAPQGARIAAVSRTPDHLDIFVVDINGNVMSAAWQTGDTKWRGWWHIEQGRAQAGAYVSAVARETQKLDIFVAATDGQVWTAAWDAKVANAQWRGWWRIGSLKVPQGAPVTVVAREATKLDVFAVGTDGAVYTAAWDQFVTNAQWRGWWPVAGGKAQPGSVVACAAREAQKLDVMTVGTDGKLYTAAWDQNRDNAQWRGWWRIGDGDFRQGVETTLLSRRPVSLDGFGAGTDGGVYLVCWNRNIARQQWRG